MTDVTQRQRHYERAHPPLAGATASRWRCPTCHASALSTQTDGVLCNRCSTHYPTIAGRPVLIASDNDVFASRRDANIAPPKTSRARRVAPSLSLNLSRKPCLVDLARRLDATHKPTAVLLVGSGSQRQQIERLFARERPDARITVVACDVAYDADVDLWCDAHELAFADASFDAVVTTAVLEHVADPSRVMVEIERVVTTGGYVYSEIPFMQQVHEGAYDFTRYTMSGHRLLAAGFDEIASGVVAGPATALGWAIEHFALAFSSGARSRAVTKFAVRWAFGWLRLFDHLLANRPAGEDGASCTYFYGQLGPRRRAPASIIDAYSGAQTPPTSSVSPQDPR